MPIVRRSKASFFGIPFVGVASWSCILLHKENGFFLDRSSVPRAVAVAVETDRLEYALSDAEVIFSAGTFHSPHLLKVSGPESWQSSLVAIVMGVGPNTVLDPHSIPVLLDSPGVDQNFVGPLQIAVSHLVNTPSGQPQTAGPALWRPITIRSRLARDHVHRWQLPESQSSDNRLGGGLYAYHLLEGNNNTIIGSAINGRASLCLAVLVRTIVFKPSCVPEIARDMKDGSGQRNQGRPNTSDRLGCTAGCAGSRLHLPQRYANLAYSRGLQWNYRAVTG
ncbi:gmc oxidoreductase protein [Apiospora aurea]|uniref:Gmc oxidoreductase protein n=1 Tax=Apiospora aurea TaxID=335848 RepID=A0ABR1PSF3_9PEZI